MRVTVTTNELLDALRAAAPGILSEKPEGFLTMAELAAALDLSERRTRERMAPLRADSRLQRVRVRDNGRVVLAYRILPAKRKKAA